MFSPFNKQIRRWVSASAVRVKQQTWNCSVGHKYWGNASVVHGCRSNWLMYIVRCVVEKSEVLELREGVCLHFTDKQCNIITVLMGRWVNKVPDYHTSCTLNTGFSEPWLCCFSNKSSFLILSRLEPLSRHEQFLEQPDGLFLEYTSITYFILEVWRFLKKVLLQSKFKFVYYKSILFGCAHLFLYYHSVL